MKTTEDPVESSPTGGEELPWVVGFMKGGWGKTRVCFHDGVRVTPRSEDVEIPNMRVSTTHARRQSGQVSSWGVQEVLTRLADNVNCNP